MKLLDSKKIEIKVGNGWNFNFSTFFPKSTDAEQNKTVGIFDVIHVGASATDFPENLMKVMKIGGKMTIPVKKQVKFLPEENKENIPPPAQASKKLAGHKSIYEVSAQKQSLYLVTRLSENEWEKKEIFEVNFVPMVGKNEPKKK